MTKMVHPNVTNTSGMALGGWLLKQLDLAAFNAAQRHHRGPTTSPPVTVSIDAVTFLGKVHAGQVLTVDASVTRTFGKSLEVEVTMRGEDPAQPEWGSWPVLRSYATFVAMGLDGKATTVKELPAPRTQRKRAAFLAAGERREGRLERMKLADGVDSVTAALPWVTWPAEEEEEDEDEDEDEEDEEDEEKQDWDEGRDGGGAAATYVEMTESVFSRHTNARGTAFGGQLLAWGGVACTISAMRYAGTNGLVLAASDEVAFLRPVQHGDTVVVHADVTAPWRSSVEVGLTIEREDPSSGDREHCLSAYFTYVLPTDTAGRRLELPPPRSGEGCRLALNSQQQSAAEERRKRRLAAAGK